MAAEFYWIIYDGSDEKPSDAFHAGVDKDGSDVYIGRVEHENECIPAKVFFCKKIAYYSYNGVQCSNTQFQYLSGDRFQWTEFLDNIRPPPGSVEGGNTADGKPYYIGRVFYEGLHIIGKVHPVRHTCSFLYDGKEITNTIFDILVIPPWL